MLTASALIAAFGAGWIAHKLLGYRPRASVTNPEWEHTAKPWEAVAKKWEDVAKKALTAASSWEAASRKWETVSDGWKEEAIKARRELHFVLRNMPYQTIPSVFVEPAPLMIATPAADGFDGSPLE